MKKRFIDYIFYITILSFFTSLLVTLFFVVKDELSIKAFVGGFQFFISFFGIFISPLFLILSIIDRLFINKTNNKHLFFSVVLNIIFLSIALYTSGHVFDGFNFI